MLSASLYIIVCSARNRLRQRLRRLREPRYLIGAVVGAAYLYFTVFARMRASRAGAERRRGQITRPPVLVLSAIRTALPGVAGLMLLAITAFAWVLPFDSGLLEFSEPEIQFLFPAPVSRRGLLAHRLLRSQIGLLFSSLIAAIILPSISGYSRLRAAAAMWVLLTTGKVYFTGISLARSRLTSASARARRVAWLPVAVLTAALVVVGRAVALAFATPPSSLQDLLARVGSVTTSGVSAIVLWPFIALARPIFAEWPWPWLTSLLPALGVMLASVVWVLQSDAAFEDVAATASQRRAQERTPGRPVYRVRASAPPLAARGRPEIAFAWKALTHTLRSLGSIALIRASALAFGIGVMAVSLTRSSGAAALVGTFALAASVFAVVLGPQVLRIDMREDLQHLEALKTWPVRAAAVVRGEMLWPGAMLTAIAWIAVMVAELMAVGTVLGNMTVAWRLSLGAGFAIVAPALVFAQLTIHNAAALIFPAWVPLGNQRSRGLDALGQRLIMFFGVWIVLIVATLPGAIAGGVVWLALARLVGPAAIVAAALACVGVIGIEVLAATEALGPVYEGIDLTGVERSE
jgi:putative ABC exporter